MKFRVNEYGEAASEGRSAIIEAPTQEEALSKAPFRTWGATVQPLNLQCPFCHAQYWARDRVLVCCQKAFNELTGNDLIPIKAQP